MPTLFDLVPSPVFSILALAISIPAPVTGGLLVWHKQQRPLLLFVGIIPDVADNVVEVAAQPLIVLGVLGRVVPAVMRP